MTVAVYLAGPITVGDQFANTGRALYWADNLKRHSFIVFVPHWGALQQMHRPWTYEDWVEYDNFWLRKCDVLFRLTGESSGSDKEVALAKDLCMPVFYENANGLELLKAYRQVRLCG